MDDDWDDDQAGCGWSYDHTVRPGYNECSECGAEIDDPAEPDCE